MQKFSDALWKDDGFDVKLYCDNYFDDEEYAIIKQALIENSEASRIKKSLP
ncbi:MAG: hypothetical protein IKI37_07690 [Oscillospiraceae bacterium]|nr:hypothetical protein [Oscillospiraceae bacterium]MBR7085042.1 hypothetical protein [Oscillospiraceae bacterium]